MTPAAGRAHLDLQNLAQREGRQTQTLLVMYVLERFLARNLHLDEDAVLRRVVEVASLPAPVAVLLARGHGVDDHLVSVLADEDDGLQEAAKWASAARMASDLLMSFFAAAASRASSSSAVSRTATTCMGSAPRPGRPRPRRFNSSTS